MFAFSLLKECESVFICTDTHYIFHVKLILKAAEESSRLFGELLSIHRTKHPGAGHTVIPQFKKLLKKLKQYQWIHNLLISPETSDFIFKR